MSAQTHYLSHYTPPAFIITHTHLHFELFEHHTFVHSKLRFERNTKAQANPVFELHGEGLEVLSLALDGHLLPPHAYQQTPQGLSLLNPPDAGEFSCTTRLYPAANTTLEGLYQSRGMYCTQCEAEGFRKITYYLDRPDALSIFTVRIDACAQQYPVLLSNGNLQQQGHTENGRHYAIWHDPFKKPAYLFALVAGQLAHTRSEFTTASGRQVALYIYVEPKDLLKCQHAMDSLKSAMKWDETVYGREYDLDLFMIVAVDDFNMGAMENKGLNIFNTACVLAHPLTTTDAGYARVEGVVAHEYFHNWSGNRVTCRDWFQLSLKEGFTVFRDEAFSADQLNATVKRVESVNLLRTSQFAEDAGPMAHPVRPSSYMEISNFYTLTVYEKGAEIVRMLHTLLGETPFRNACDLYFARHDGEAVCVEDFVQAMADTSGRNLGQFMYWYTQAGTPEVHITGHYCQASNSYQLHFSQSCPSTPEATAQQKHPFHIPIRLGLLGEHGPLVLQSKHPAFPASQQGLTEWVFELTQPQDTLVFEGLHEAPVPSLFRHFSAPVKAHFHYSQSDLLRLMLHDSDGVNRWDASQQLALQLLASQQQALSQQAPFQLPPLCLQAYQQLLSNPTLDPAMVALMLELPSEAFLAQQQNPITPIENHRAREALRLCLAQQLEPYWWQAYERNQQAGPFSPSASAVAKRSLKNTALGYLALLNTPQSQQAVRQQFENRQNMTCYLAAFKLIVNAQQGPLQAFAPSAIQAFYEHAKEDPLMVNLWLQVQATASQPNALAAVKALLQHPAYDAKNPNKIRSLISAFANQNPVHFHAENGEGYRFLAEVIQQLNQQNPQIAARLLTPLTQWKKYDPTRQALMKAQLEHIVTCEGLSKDVYEVVTKSLV